MLDHSKQREPKMMPTACPSEPSDTALILRIRASDTAAFEALYKRYYPKLFRFAFRVTRQVDQLEEIINDVMYVVWKKASTFHPESRASTWIFGIAYNKCMKSLSGRLPGEHLELEDAEGLIPGVQDSGLQSLELEDWISVAFSKLTEDQRAVLELTYHYGLNYGEIARIMDCPENTVKTRMFNARKKIKALFPDFVAESSADHKVSIL
jgi:RNA polymerase sigma factor (sigma-70 family)